MTHQENWNVPGELLEGLAASGLDYLPELIRILVNAAMRAEREAWLGAAAYERNPQRRGYANGYKPKTVNTRLGQITFDVPQVRQGQFYPSALEKGMRSERALHLTMAEMDVQGVSTRKVQAVIEWLCGTAVSSTQVSRAAAQLDEVLESWRQRPLGRVRYLYLDARYEKVRIDGQIRDAALLIAAGVGWDGMRSILGVSVSLGEQEVHWRQFLESLVQRGLRGVQLIISDDHAGLKAARRAVFGAETWQPPPTSCTASLGRNVPTQSGRQPHDKGTPARYTVRDRDKGRPSPSLSVLWEPLRFVVHRPDTRLEPARKCLTRVWPCETAQPWKRFHLFKARSDIP
ncbi:MAG: transposase [Ardenticatenia bacterium]|nr:transposase [Ardenticatenia bacterium]